jgi:hypothetical protein
LSKYLEVILGSLKNTAFVEKLRLCQISLIGKKQKVVQCMYRFTFVERPKIVVFFPFTTGRPVSSTRFPVPKQFVAKRYITTEANLHNESKQ